MSRSRRSLELVVLAIVGVAVGQVAVMAQGRLGSPRKEAKRPEFSAELRSVFFPDARLELGPGEPGRKPAETPEPVPSSTPAGDAPKESTGQGWSELVSGEVLEDEVKSYVNSVAENTRSLNAFKSGGYQEIRDDYSVLAILFGVIAQFDGDVRWKQQAAGMRAALARAGFNCKVATEASFKESKLRGEDLATLVRGGSPELPDSPVVVEEGWSSVSDLSPLMKRMEQSQRGRLDVWTANSNEFERNIDELFHEANLLRLLAEVIHDPSYEYAEDELYIEYVDAMRKHCDELIEAIGQSQFEAAQSAVSGINQQCDLCHGDFRG